MVFREVVEGIWLRLWEELKLCIPLPRGLSDFTVALLISTAAVFMYGCCRRLGYAALTALWGLALLSAIAYCTAP
ncbi:MAG: hypothetical protein QW369_04445 [Desulfurococcaceae archaeon]